MFLYHSMHELGKNIHFMKVLALRDVLHCALLLQQCPDHTRLTDLW